MNHRESCSDPAIGQLPLRCARQQDILVALRQHHTGPLFIVGGFLRDACLGQDPSLDMDLVFALDEDLCIYLEIARHHGWQGFILDASRAHVRLLDKPGPHGPDAAILTVDLAPLAGGGIARDLARRDCTANAMALEIQDVADGWVTGLWRDPFDGRADLAAGMLRPVALDNLRADPLRMVRMFRLGHTCRLDLDTAMVQFITCHHAAVREVKPFRLWQEVWTWLSHAGQPISRVLRPLDATGMLDHVLPAFEGADPGITPGLTPAQFLTLMDRIQALAFHDGNTNAVWWHRHAVSPSLARQLQAVGEASLAAGITRRQWWIYLGFLVGKRLTRVPGNQDASPFRLSLGHEDRLQRHMRESGVAKMLRKHSGAVLQGCATLLQLLAQPAFPRGDRKALHRLMMQAGWTRDVSVCVDIMAILGAVDSVVPLAGADTENRFSAACRDILALLAESALGKPRPLVSASELQAWFGLQPGPEIGRLLDQLLEAQARRIVSTPEEARRYIEELQ